MLNLFTYRVYLVVYLTYLLHSLEAPVHRFALSPINPSGKVVLRVIESLIKVQTVIYLTWMAYTRGLHHELASDPENFRTP